MARAKVFTGVPAGVARKTFEKVVSAARVCYLMDDDTLVSIARLAGVSEAKAGAVLSSPEFKERMRLSGINWTKRTAMTPEQTYVVQVLTDPTKSRMTLSKKLALAGITYTTYRNWMKQPAFQKAVETISEQMLGDNIANVHTAVVGKAVNGDLTAAKMVYELTGRYDPGRSQAQDLQLIIQRLLSVITMHVRDADTLAAIANDMNGVVEGRAPEHFALPANYSPATPVVIEDAITIEDEEFEL